MAGSIGDLRVGERRPRLPQLVVEEPLGAQGDGEPIVALAEPLEERDRRSGGSGRLDGHAVGERREHRAGGAAHGALGELHERRVLGVDEALLHREHVLREVGPDDLRARCQLVRQILDRRLRARPPQGEPLAEVHDLGHAAGATRSSSRPLRSTSTEARPRSSATSESVAPPVTE